MPANRAEPIKTYGCKIRDQPQSFYNRAAFAFRSGVDSGAPPRYELFKIIAEELLPGHFEWHSWTERVITQLCDTEGAGPGQKSVILRGMPGSSGSAKTFNIVGFGIVWWLCAPGISSVTLVSTTVKSLRRRGWSEVQKCFSKLEDKEGNFVDSRLLWQIDKGDDKHAIIGRAVEEGSTHKVADDIKGVHTARQMVIIDEATAVPEAIYEASANLYSYPDEFIMVLIGNPRNRLDAFGRFCEPAAGWTSVTVDTGEWEAKPFDACGGHRPYVITLDAEKSPNITEGRTVSRHLPTLHTVEAAKRNSGGVSPLYWTNFRGFWPPEGLVKTVFSESALIRFDGFGKHRFTGESFQIIGAFDPAYTSDGDRAALRFAKLGLIEPPQDEAGNLLPSMYPIRWGIEVMPPIIIPINPHSKNPAHYQLSEQLRRQCESVQVGAHTMSCPPQNLGVDDSGEGGLCDILYRTWSDQIIRIEFGGRPSDEPCSIEDVRLASDVYQNKRAEMAFRSRDALNSGQLKGIDPETAIELTTVEFDDVGRPKIVLISKKDYRLKYGKSPDLFDSLTILTEVARQKGFRLAPVGVTAKTVEEADEAFQNNQAMFEAEHLYEPEEVF